MYRKLIGLALAFTAVSQAYAADVEPQQFVPLTPLQQQTAAAHLTSKLIGEHHYKPIALDDAMSEKIFDSYLKALDPEKMYFLQADINQLKTLRDGWLRSGWKDSHLWPAQSEPVDTLRQLFLPFFKENYQWIVDQAAKQKSA